MDATILLIIGLIAGAALGFLLATVLAHSKGLPLRQRAQQADVLEAELATAKTAAESVQSSLSTAQSEITTLREATATATAQSSAYREQLEKTEAQLQQLNQQQVAEKQQESRVIEKLAPVSKSMDTMRQKIAELEEARLRQDENLSKTIGQLQATTNTLAGTLTKSQERGRWGEVQLEQIFENAGLIETVHFERQSTSAQGSTSDTRIRPDFLLKLPNGRIVPIDAKVPFDSYDKACEIPLSAEPAELARRDELLRGHAAALKDHIKALARKEYGESLPGAPDFVVAFLPAEALLSAALEADPQLVDYAFSQRVALASPVTLWSIVKSIAYAWQQQEASENAQEIVEAGKELLKRMATLAGHSTKLQRNLDNTVKSYNEFASSLERNLLTQAEKLQRLDMSKELPAPEQIERTTQGFSKPELLSETS
ncbi:MAG: DNA recombination protein RmuC [Coriobacteriia bacterium]|nr:DNA recombination protein RmuC [Coriobacteriia bacterium]MCL2536818.1 DNA recombination protein RmuC [Coriobacteriia bacterium]